MEKIKLHVIKIGGNIIDNPDALNLFLTNFALIPGYKILVHCSWIHATRRHDYQSREIVL
jgi:acetylglutamate kinase